MRTPERFEKHNGYYWIFVQPYTACGEVHYALGGYENIKDAHRAWADLLKTMRKEDPDYERELPEIPVDYSPREYERTSARTAKRRRSVVVRTKPRHARGDNRKLIASKDTPSQRGIMENQSVSRERDSRVLLDC